jgi:small-conductance mechanosensitive channel/CRP-like cAMP-binding protein
VFLIAVSFAGMLICGLLPHHQPPDGTYTAYRYVNFAALLLFTLAVLNLSAVLVFRVLLPLVRLQPPPILRDSILGVAYVIAALTLLSRHGVNLSGIVATSAVVTAIIGFSLQDTLGNIMGGMALQMEQSISVGDWIRIGDVEGIVREIRWRQTSIETRNWDTVVIPNSSLMKSQVTVLGRRQGKPKLHRMAVEFNVDFRHPPAHVIETVQNALRAESTPNVAEEPLPSCILFEFRDSYARYRVRFWIIDFASDLATGSEVSLRVVAALERAGMGMSIPAQRVFLTMQGETRARRKHHEEVQRRKAALEHVSLLKPLTDSEREEIAERVLVAPFRRGEVILRQGSEAHYLYILVVGSVELSVTEEGQTRVITRIGAGEAFGEMGLMTGEPRSATVIAVTDVVCYRLDKAGFQDILQRRPEIAETLAGLLAERKEYLDALKRGLHMQALEHALGGSQADLLHRIRDFFMLSG